MPYLSETLTELFLIIVLYALFSLINSVTTSSLTLIELFLMIVLYALYSLISSISTSSLTVPIFVQRIYNSQV